MTIRIGTSGWVYPHWRGLFYPAELRQQDWFAHYAGCFDTVEINNTFYRLPSAAAFDRWRQQAPPGFCYALKASRFLTHLKKLKDPEPPLATFFDRARHLEGTLGPVLYQLPPHWHFNKERFAAFLDALPAKATHVVEFRDPSWLCKEAFALLERHQVGHCLHDMPPLQVPLRVTSNTVYLRFHGGADYSADYAPPELERWAQRIDDWHRQGLAVYAYFNNDAGAHAVKNARMLQQLLNLPAAGSRD